MSSQPELLDAFSVEHLHADLKGRSVRAGAQSMAAQVAQILLQSVATVVLARLLSPVDFGLVAMVTAVTAIAASTRAAVLPAARAAALRSRLGERMRSP